MSNGDAFSEAVKWFTELSDTDKGRVFEALESGEEELVSSEDMGHVRAIITRVQDAISESGRDGGIETLRDAGVSEAHSQLLVEKIIERAPPTEVVVEDLNSTSDEEFSLIVEIAVSQYVRTLEEEEEEDLQDIQPNSTSIDMLMSIIREPFMEYLRGEGTADQFERTFEEVGIDPNRASEIVNVYQEYEDAAFRRLVFKNVQDILFNEMRDLKDQQRRTQQLLDELLTIVENAARDSDT